MLKCNAYIYYEGEELIKDGGYALTTKYYRLMKGIWNPDTRALALS